MPIRFELVGMLIGIAIYNSILLDIKFPLTIYKKLCDYKVDLGDLYEIDSDLYKGLKHIL